MKKKYLLLFLPLLLFLFFYPKESLQASCQGVDLWFHTVLPTLLPFIILSNILIRSGLILPLLSRFNPLWNRLLGLSSGGAYAWFLGVFCGYPMGARLTANLCREGKITREEGTYLLSFCNNASPMFLSGFLALQKFQDTSLMIPVYLIYYTAAVLTMIFFRICYHRFSIRSSCTKKETSHPLSPGELMDVSIMDGFDVIARLGGYIILFTIYAHLLARICAPLPLLHPVMAMLLEITTGTGAVLSTAWKFQLKFTFVLAGTAFGGISTAAQTASMIRGSGLSFSSYLKAKLLQGFITFLIAWLYLLFII